MSDVAQRLSASVERVPILFRAGDDRAGSPDRVRDKDASQVRLACVEIVVGTADDFDENVAKVTILLAVLDGDSNAAAGGVLLDFQLERTDEDQAAGIEILATADG